MPFEPQVDTLDVGHMFGERGARPDGTNEHTPGESATLQDLHVSVQAVLQQTPSTQKLLWQSAAQPHAMPFERDVPPDAT